MRNYRLIACLIIGTLLLLPLIIHPAQAQNYYEYNVQVQSDGTANWTVIQFSDANATVDSFDMFQQKVFDIVDAASSLTHRAMTVDVNSLQINTTVVADSKTTEYSFTWENFTVVRANQLVIGDVFQVNNFFAQLYGDAALQLSYPAEFTVKSVTPTPFLKQNNELQWSRTQDLTSNPVDIVLVSNNQAGSSSNSNWQLYAAVIFASAVSVGIILFGIHRFRRRKNNSIQASPDGFSPLVSEEDKLLKLLKASGGRMRQSQITEQSKFSKAKTSHLLSVLEENGIVTRYKSGRDKIVTLKERVKGE